MTGPWLKDDSRLLTEIGKYLLICPAHPRVATNNTEVPPMLVRAHVLILYGLGPLTNFQLIDPLQPVRFLFEDREYVMGQVRLGAAPKPQIDLHSDAQTILVDQPMPA